MSRRFRARIAPASAPKYSARNPNSPARRIASARCADSSSVLLGMQPRRMHSPPTSCAAFDHRRLQPKARRRRRARVARAAAADHDEIVFVTHGGSLASSTSIEAIERQSIVTRAEIRRGHVGTGFAAISRSSLPLPEKSGRILRVVGENRGQRFGRRRHAEQHGRGADLARRLVGQHPAHFPRAQDRGGDRGIMLKKRAVSTMPGRLWCELPATPGFPRPIGDRRRKPPRREKRPGVLPCRRDGFSQCYQRPSGRGCGRTAPRGSCLEAVRSSSTYWTNATGWRRPGCIVLVWRMKASTFALPGEELDAAAAERRNASAER